MEAVSVENGRELQMEEPEDSPERLASPLCNMPSLKFAISDYLKHLRLFHGHQANLRFTCNISGCQRSYTNIGTFQNHVYSVHYCKGAALRLGSAEQAGLTSSGGEQNDANEVNEGISGDQESGSSEDFLTEGHAASVDLPPLQHSSALFLLGLKEKYKLTQVSIQGVIDGITSLNQHQIALLKSQVGRYCRK